MLGGGVGVAVLSSILPYSLELIALRRLRAAAFGLLMSLEPAVAALAGVLLLGQSLRLVTRSRSSWSSSQASARRSARAAGRPEPEVAGRARVIVRRSGCDARTACSTPIASPCANIDDPP